MSVLPAGIVTALPELIHARHETMTDMPLLVCLRFGAWLQADWHVARTIKQLWDFVRAAAAAVVGRTYVQHTEEQTIKEPTHSYPKYPKQKIGTNAYAAKLGDFEVVHVWEVSDFYSAKKHSLLPTKMSGDLSSDAKRAVSRE